ncbi:MAG: ATP-binding protein [Bacteroidia bacterium]|nr:ATP-binding protein [Bacteroidia bacterium]
MKKILKTIITNFHTTELKSSYQRKIDLPVNSGIIISLIGVRRSGKTFLLYETIKKILKSSTPIHKILYINFEDERINLNQSELDLILQAYQELYPQLKLEECYFFFDEILNIPGWEKFIRRIFDTISTNIYITGSNSKILSTEIATELRGRTISYTLYPLNFSEFLHFNDTGQSFYGTKQKTKILGYCNEFMYYGGFPELIKLDENLKIKKLQDYFNSIIYKDLIERYQISNPSILKLFIKKILTQVTKPFSVNKLHNDIKSLGYKVGNNILYEYLEYIQATFTAVLINKFDYSEIKQSKSEKKAYSIDTGILTALDYSFSENYGKLLENMIALEILKAQKEVSYFKNIIECDFIVKEKNNYTPVQVCFSMKNSDTKKREINGLVKACEFFNVKTGYIVTFDEEKTEKTEKTTIETIPAYKFMLEFLKS